MSDAIPKSAPPASPLRKPSRQRLLRTRPGPTLGASSRNYGFDSLVADSDEGEYLAKALTQKQISRYEFTPTPTSIGSGADGNDDAVGQSQGVPRAACSSQIPVSQQEPQALRSKLPTAVTAQPGSAKGGRGAHHTEADLINALAQGAQRTEAEVMKALAEGFGTVNSKLDFLKEWLLAQDQDARERKDQNACRLLAAQERQDQLMRQIMESQDRIEPTITNMQHSSAKAAELCVAWGVSPESQLDSNTMSIAATAASPESMPMESMDVTSAVESDSSNDDDDDVPDNLFVTPHFHIIHTEKPAPPPSFLESIVDTNSFEYASAFVILMHSLFISVYVEYIATVDSEGHTFFKVGNVVLTTIFVLELLVKISAEGQKFCLGKEKFWNLFDVCLMLLVFLELILGIVLAGKDKKKMKTVLKMAEMARTLRILRIFRFLKFSSTLQIVIVKVLTSIKTLSWVLLLIFMMQAVAAVCFTQGVNDFLNGRQHDPDVSLTEAEQAMRQHFGSVPRSIKTCFASISGGIMWEAVSQELGYISVAYELVFAVYIVASTFAMLNIITGIFINDMMRAEADLEGECQIKKMDVRHDKLSEMFNQLDGAGNGRINLEQFLSAVKEPLMVQIFDDIGMTSLQATSLFHLLDEDQSGDLEVDEFLDGCLHLMQGSTGLDMKLQLYETRRLRHRFTQFMQHTQHRLHDMSREMKKQSKFSRKMAAAGGGKRYELNPAAIVAKSPSEKEDRYKILAQAPPSPRPKSEKPMTLGSSADHKRTKTSFAVNSRISSSRRSRVSRQVSTNT